MQSRILGLEKLIHQDPGKRGLQAIWDELIATGQDNKMLTMLSAAQTLATSCKKAIVVRICSPKHEMGPSGLPIAQFGSLTW